MSDPVIDPSDLGTYLNDPSINVDRATAVIADSQTLCESVVSPLPAGASVVVKRVAARAYASILSSRQAQMQAAGSQFGSTPGGIELYLSRTDIADLRRLNGGGGAFSIDLLPSDYVAPVSSYIYGGDWDQIP